MARPGKVAAEEAIVMAARHDVDVEVRHALADHIVDRHERAVATGSLRHGASQTLREGEEWAHFADGQIGKGRHMLPGHEQNVAGQEWSSIEEGDARWIVEDDLGGGTAPGGGSEDTPGIARTIGGLEHNVEDHGGPCSPSRLASRYSP